MYVITVLFGILAVVSLTTADFEKEFKEVILPKCMSEHKVDPSMVDKMFQPNVQLEPTTDNKCFLKCIYVKFGMLDDAGKITVENLNAELKNDAKSGKVDECSKKADIVKPDPCDTAFEMHKCLTT